MAVVAPRSRPDIRLERLPDGSAVLFDPRTAMTYAITSSAAVVWERCDGAHSPDAITDVLSHIYDAPREVIAKDVHALLAHFHSLGLLDTDGGELP